MKARKPLLVTLALAAAVTLTAVAAAGPEAATQRVMFTSQAGQTTTVAPAVFTPLQAGPLKSDSGPQTGVIPPERVVMRQGQKVSVYDGVSTFEGKRGSLVTRYHTESVGAGGAYSVSTSTWKVVRGTGQYAGVTGGGRGGGVWNSRTDAWSSQDEGVLVLP